MKKFDINELNRIAGMAKTPDTRTASQQLQQTTATIYERLNGQTGKQTNLGVIGHWRAKNHEHGLSLDNTNKINGEKYKLVADVSITALRNEVQLISEQMRIEFNQQYAALAERSAVGEIMALRKFEAVCEVARDLLLEDRFGAYGRVTERYDAGYLTDEDYAEELNHLKDRYQRLRHEVIEIVNERGDNVRNAFRPTNRY
jgi:hypothetical protein